MQCHFRSYETNNNNNYNDNEINDNEINDNETNKINKKNYYENTYIKYMKFIQYILCILCFVFVLLGLSILACRYLHNKNITALEKTTIIFREKLLIFINDMEEDKIKLNISINNPKSKNNIDDIDDIAKIRFYNFIDTQIKIFRDVYNSNNNETYTMLNILTIDFTKASYKIELLKYLQNDIINNGYISITKLSKIVIKKLQHILETHSMNVCYNKDKFTCHKHEYLFNISVST